MSARRRSLKKDLVREGEGSIKQRRWKMKLMRLIKNVQEVAGEGRGGGRR